jgi:hypothetical protein
VLSQSPLWSDILARAEAQISGRRQVRGQRPSSLEGTASAVARAHSRFLVALESGSRLGEDAVSQVAMEAVELLVVVARVWGTLGARGKERRAWLADQLGRRLAAQEDAVLSGEVTYCVWSEQAEEPSAAMRQAIGRLSRDSDASEGDLLSLSIAAVDLASLLVRLAANATASGRGGGAAEHRTATLDTNLAAVTAELAYRSREAERPAHERGDVAAHHLAAGLRVRFCHQTLTRVSAGVAGRAADRADLGGLREAWLGLASNEYAAIAAIDCQLTTPSYDESSLSAAILDGAARLICGARLLGRPEAFRHPRAWRHQTVALSYALEAYVAGLRGQPASLAQAQRIALTRLVRATVAIVLIDLHRDTLHANGAPVT